MPFQVQNFLVPEAKIGSKRSSKEGKGVGRNEARAGGMSKEPEETRVCKDHPEHLDHPGRSLNLKRLRASMAHRPEDLERERTFQKVV